MKANSFAHLSNISLSESINRNYHVARFTDGVNCFAPEISEKSKTTLLIIRAYYDCRNFKFKVFWDITVSMR